ncbi:MAG TPA: acetate--CoA ligase family protein [Candidatus Dojkabacteria bacterium]|nr:acetate--CoA ligase family protein [Candidatus Dojkabacteria bacterium]
MEKILSPKSIAIVGVSNDLQKVGSVLLRNLLEGGYNGKVYPINPKYTELQGRQVFPNILAVNDDIDLVCISLPYQLVEEIVDQCIMKKVKTVLIVSAGFSETGQEGRELEERIANKLKGARIRLIGPNCLGFINNKAKINLSFARSNPGDGNIAFISQSGAFCTAILDMAEESNSGFGYVISVGNKADINENELLPYFISNPLIKAIAIYLEEFSDGKEFVSIAQRSKKPILLIAPGSSEKSKQAISSHTGSLASSYDTVLAAVKKANLLLVENSEELYKLIELVDMGYMPKGKNVAVVSNAGGPGITAVDSAEREGLEIISLGEKTQQKLKRDLPVEASFENPVDVLGDAKSDRYASAIETVIEDVNTNSVVILLTPQLMTDIEGTANAIVEISKKTSKPLFACFLGGKEVKNGFKILTENKLPWFNDVQEAMHLISKLANFEQNKNLNKIVDSNKFLRKTRNKKELFEFVEGDEEIKVLPDDLAIKILNEFGIDTPKQIVTSSLEQARDFASTAFPVAIKASAQDLAHKTDHKGLYLDIRTISEFEKSFEELKETITKVTGNTSPEILIQEMVDSKIEFFIGANREGDSHIYEKEGIGFGHLVAIGKGGVYTEVYKDIKHVLIPETREKVNAILSETRVSMIIDGYRGKPKLAREKLLDLIMKIQSMLITYPEIVSMDINPVMLNENRAVVVDIKLYVKK